MLTIFNTIVGVGIILAILGIVGVFAMMFLGETKSALFQWIKKYSVHIGFLIAFAGVFGSLMYSEVFKFAPCTFCWWQRIFLYPQVIVFGLGAYYHEKKIWITGVVLSLIGICFSAYHVLLQAGIVGANAACVTSGVSCEKIDVLIFGWITIPIMCLVLFASILTVSYVAHRE